ncbi:MAG: AI-2E family transporter YdiK [Candidatus Binataceae bacterium]
MSEFPTNRATDLARIMMQVLAFGALVAASFWIIRPFLVAAVWAATVAVATWPLLLRAQLWCGGRRSLAVALMTIALLLILVAPFFFAVITIADNVDQITSWSKSLATLTLSGPPNWVHGIPVVGTRIATRWQEVAAAGPEELSASLSPLIRRMALWFLSQAGNLGLLLVQFLLTVIIAAILFARGDRAAQGLERFVLKLLGPEGVKALHLAAPAVRGVALGIVVTAIVQSAFAGLGLAVAGVPFATLLTALMFVLTIAQIGPLPVLIGAVIWTYSQSGPLWGTGLLLWSIFCATFDNILRPLLIRRGADLPLLLIFVGVIGGLVAFGVIGLFIGPVVLAVAYTLLVDWVSDEEMVPSPTDSNGTK